MNDIKTNLAKNIAELRLINGFTQIELAEKLNYSDKTISKWERGESSPDITALVEMAELFGVSLDCMVREENIEKAVNNKPHSGTKYNRRIISYLSESTVWFIAVFAFIITSLITNRLTFQWLYFAYALPPILIIKLIFNSIWFNPRNNYYIISALIWVILAVIHMTFLYFGVNVILIYLLGVVGQIVIIMWSFIKKPKSK